MSWGMVAVAVVGAVGAGMSADAAGDAADAQAGAAENATALQKYMFDQQAAMQRPWLDAGGAGLNRLAFMMGLSPVGFGGPGGVGNGMPTVETPEQTRARLLESFTTRTGGVMPPVSTDPTATPTANVDGSGQPGATPTVVTVDEIKLAEAIAADQKRQKLAYDQAMTKATRVANRDPNYGSLLDKFSMDDFQQDPGYQFRLDQGSQALDRRLAAGGKFYSGQALKDGQRFTQGMASQEFGAAFDRFNVGQTNQFNRLASISGIGQTAANQTGAAGQNYANQAGANMLGAGNAIAAGRVGQANAWNGAIGQGVSMYQQNQLMNSLNNPVSTPSYYGGLGGGSGNYNYGGGF